MDVVTAIVNDDGSPLYRPRYSGAAVVLSTFRAIMDF